MVKPFLGRINNESEVNSQPFLDFSLKIAEVAMSCTNNSIH